MKRTRSAKRDADSGRRRDDPRAADRRTELYVHRRQGAGELDALAERLRRLESHVSPDAPGILAARLRHDSLHLDAGELADAHRVRAVATLDPQNVASLALLRPLGFTILSSDSAGNEITYVRHLAP